jgi:hypothetical protein
MARLLPPAGGAIVRFYRIGHGDCFLIAFASDDPQDPSYVLIDFGYKPGSPAFIDPPTDVDSIVEDMVAATGGRLNVAIITHEHQDHVNAITEARLGRFTIGQTWFSWIEQPDDVLAKALRKEHDDTVMGLVAARNKLTAAGFSARAALVDEFLALEMGGTIFGLTNRRAQEVIKDAATAGPRYLRPHTSRALPGASDVRAYVLGPPRNAELLKVLDPEGDEEFHVRSMDVGRLRDEGAYFAAAARDGEGETSRLSPFEARFAVPFEQAFKLHDQFGEFVNKHYGDVNAPPVVPKGEQEVPTNAEFRRIDHEWLRTADSLAIKMGNYTNNTSLVLAFELGRGGKVLLFVADAQRGNWLSWNDDSWMVGGKKMTAEELLARTVLYKVGHHGSHNATLNGRSTDDYPNLSWMGHDDAAREFTAMITAVRDWAQQPKVDWDHPYGPIKDALLKKTHGRVFQTDTPFGDMQRLAGSSRDEWDQFSLRARGTDLYFDYTIDASTGEDTAGPGGMGIAPPEVPWSTALKEPLRISPPIFAKHLKERSEAKKKKKKKRPPKTESNEG